MKDLINGQPEQDIEHCATCIHTGDSEDICILRKCKYAIAELKDCYEPKQPEQRWISCNERLPEEDAKSYAPYDEHLSAFVLVTLDGQTWPFRRRTVKLARYSHTIFEWRVANNNTGKVIAWMPLPEPYKGGEDE